MKFDEVDDFLSFAVPMTPNYEVYVIVHATRSSYPGPSNNSDPDLTSGVGGGDTLEVSFYNGFVTTANPRLTTQQMTNRWINGDKTYSGGAIALNSSHIGSATVGSPLSNIGHFLGKYSDSTHFSPDAIKGLIIYSTTHTDAERALIHAWSMQAGRYGI